MSMRADLQEVRLKGEAGRLFGRAHWFQLDSGKTSEAMAAILANFPAAEAYFMQSKDRGVGFAVFRGKRNLIAEELTDPTIEGPIVIAPVIMGSKNAGVFNIILGVVLIAVSAIADYVTEGGFSSATGGYTYAAGWAMIAGGVVSLLTPAPKVGKPADAAQNQSSYVFSGAVNTQAQGNPVPLLYGEMIVGSAVISAGIQAEDVIASQGPASGANGGMGGGGRNALPL